MACEEFVNAIHRKVLILAFHREQLNAALTAPFENPIPIPVQAHFEGVLASFAACADQIAAGLCEVTGVREQRIGLGRFLDLVDSEQPPFRSLQELWRTDQRRDMSEVRRRALHFHYHKSTDEGRYSVDAYIDRGLENRELRSYAVEVQRLTGVLADLGIGAMQELH